MKAWRFFFQPSMIKIMLLLAFFCNLYGWQDIHEAFTKPSVPVNQEKQLQKELAFRGFSDKVIKEAENAKARGHEFYPQKYFENLRIVECKRRELGLDVQLQYYVLAQLRSLMQSSIEKQYNTEEFNTALRDYKDFVDPARESRANVRAKISKLGLAGILHWFFRLYLMTLPLALILYLLWIREERQKLEMPNPFRFMLLLILYPYVLGHFLFEWIKQGSREVYAEAELRRTKKQLFTYLSDEELTRVKSFARSNLSFSCWKMQLAKTGLRPRHGLVLALVVTFVFLMLPRPSKAEVRGAKMIRDGGIVLEQMTTTHLPRMSTDADGSQISQKMFPTDQDANADWPTVDYFQVIQAAWVPDYLTRKYILFREIFHIPI